MAPFERGWTPSKPIAGRLPVPNQHVPALNLGRYPHFCWTRLSYLRVEHFSKSERLRSDSTRTGLRMLFYFCVFPSTRHNFSACVFFSFGLLLFSQNFLNSSCEFVCGGAHVTRAMIFPLFCSVEFRTISVRNFPADENLIPSHLFPKTRSLAVGLATRSPRPTTGGLKHASWFWSTHDYFGSCC